MKVKCIQVGNNGKFWNAGFGPQLNEILEALDYDRKKGYYVFDKYRKKDGECQRYADRFFVVVEEEEAFKASSSKYNPWICNYPGAWGSIIGPKEGEIFTPARTTEDGLYFNEFRNSKEDLIYYPKCYFIEVLAKESKPNFEPIFKKDDKLYCVVSDEQLRKVGIRTKEQRDGCVEYGQEVIFESYSADECIKLKGYPDRQFPDKWFIKVD